MNVTDKEEYAFQFSWLVTEWIMLPLTGWVKQETGWKQKGRVATEGWKDKEFSFRKYLDIQVLIFTRVLFSSRV